MSTDSQAGQHRAVPLASLADGTAARLVTVEGGMGLRSRLTAMGLRAGAQVRVVHNGGHGPFVISAGGTRIVLGRDMAHRVIVAPDDAVADASPAPDCEGRRGGG